MPPCRHLSVSFFSEEEPVGCMEWLEAWCLFEVLQEAAPYALQGLECRENGVGLCGPPLLSSVSLLVFPCWDVSFLVYNIAAVRLLSLGVITGLLR